MHEPNYINMNYGDNLQPHLLEQYKLYVEMMDRISTKRGQINTFYTSLLSGILVLLSTFQDKKFFPESQNFLLLLLGLLGLSLCFVWFLNINHHSQNIPGSAPIITDSPNGLL